MLLASFLPKAYPLIYLGEFLMGASNSALITMSAQMANNWFPQNEIGKAMIAFPQGSALAALVAFLIPSIVFANSHQPITQINETSEMFGKFTNISSNVKTNFVSYNCGLLAVTLILIVPVIAIVQDQPPNPPTEAQALLRCISHLDENSENLFFKDCRKVLTSRVFWILFFMWTIRHAVISTETMFISEIIRYVSSDSNVQQDSNILSGYITSTFEAGAFIGLISGACIFDHFMKHVLHLKVSFAFMFFCQLGLFCGTYFKLVKIIWAFNAGLGFFASTAVAPIYDTAVQHMYPIKPGLTASLLNLVVFAGVIVVVQSMRFLMMFFGG